MPTKRTVHVTREIAAAPQAIWDRISNHPETHTWVHAARVRLLKPGETMPNGTGAIREVSFPEKRFWTTIQERVTDFQPPRTFSYQIVAMPGVRHHLGTLTVEPLDEKRSRLTWHVEFVFSSWHPMGWISGSFTKTFAGVVQAALDELARQMGAA
jgi:hypothetical protein